MVQVLTVLKLSPPLSPNSIEKFFYNTINKDRKHEIVSFILNCPEVQLIFFSSGRVEYNTPNQKNVRSGHNHHRKSSLGFHSGRLRHPLRKSASGLCSSLVSKPRNVFHNDMNLFLSGMLGDLGAIWTLNMTHHNF